jgi:hypothetical protein
MSRLVPFALALAAATACTGRGDTGQRDDVEETDANDDTDTDYGDVEGFIIEGTAKDLEKPGEVSTAGLCVSAVDPSPVFIGQPPDILRTATVNADGTFALVGIETDSSLGVLMLVDDCEGAAEDTVFPTASGVAVEDYASLGDGDIVEGRRDAWSISQTFRATLDADLAAAGATEFFADGVLMGAVALADDTPIAGAVVKCVATSCTQPAVFYADEDWDTDGIFKTGGTNNAETIAGDTARALYFSPGANIQSYSADDGGAHSFTSRTAGSFAGWAVYVTFYAN